MRDWEGTSLLTPNLVGSGCPSVRQHWEALERLIEAFRQYTPMDPQADESRAAVLLAFVNQAALDIRRKLQRIERLGEQSIQDLVRAAEKVFNNRKTPEEREE